MWKRIWVKAVQDYYMNGLKIFDKGDFYVLGSMETAKRLEKEGIVVIQD